MRATNTSSARPNSRPSGREPLLLGVCESCEAMVEVLFAKGPNEWKGLPRPELSACAETGNECHDGKCEVSSTHSEGFCCDSRSRPSETGNRLGIKRPGSRTAWRRTRRGL